MIQDKFEVWTDKLRTTMELLENLWMQDNAGVDLDTFLENQRREFDALKDTGDIIESTTIGFDMPYVDPRCPAEVYDLLEAANSFKALFIDAQSYLQWLTAQHLCDATSYYDFIPAIEAELNVQEQNKMDLIFDLYTLNDDGTADRNNLE